MLLEAKGEFLTPADVAARLKVSLPMVYRLLNPKSPGAPHLESYRLGVNRRIPESALIDFLEKAAK